MQHNSGVYNSQAARQQTAVAKGRSGRQGRARVLGLKDPCRACSCAVSGHSSMALPKLTILPCCWLTVAVLQSDDPARDFRGAGLYGLDNLIYMGTHHPALFKQLMLKTQASPRASPTARQLMPAWK